MKKAQRIPYVALTTVSLPGGGDILMCSFCAYADWYGSCGDASCECGHPLLQRSMDFEAQMEGAQAGEDCWGFRPRYDIEEAADMVGIWLNGQEVSWV